jgi:hypothetical protein
MIDHSWVQTWEPNGAAAGKVFDDEVLQKLRDRLGGIATKIQVVTSACQSEYFAREGSRLNGDWSSAASRGIRLIENNTWSTENTYRTCTGIRISNTEWGYGWGPQYVRGIQDNAARTARQLFDFAVANDHELRTGARFDSSGAGGNNATLRAMNAKSVAGVFAESSGRNSMIKTIREVLVGAGYANNEIDLAYADNDQTLGFTVDRGAARDELLGNTGMIEQMRTRLNAATETDKRAFLLLWGHGGRQRRAAPAAPKPMPKIAGSPNGPAPPPPGATAIVAYISTDPAFADDFFLGLAPTPELSVGSRPGVQLTTRKEGAPVSALVSIDDVVAGVLTLNSGSLGGFYDLELKPETWGDLKARGTLADGWVAIRFDLPPGALVEVATPADFESHWSRSWGVGLSTAGLRIERSIEPLCRADYDGDGDLDGEDQNAFMVDFSAGRADWNGDGVTDGADLSAYQAAWAAGC